MPETAKQAGEVRARWAWTEAAVWTDRIDQRSASVPAALEKGVKGDQWFSLIDKVASELNLFVSTSQVARNKGAPGIDQLVKSGYVHVVDADLKAYFDTIPHDMLMARIREKIGDGRVLELIERFLKQGVMEGLATWTPESGCPQGAVVNPQRGNTINWRAGCGRSARPVRREGGPKSIGSPYPYRFKSMA